MLGLVASANKGEGEGLVGVVGDGVLEVGGEKVFLKAISVGEEPAELDLFWEIPLGFVPSGRGERSVHLDVRRLFWAVMKAGSCGACCQWQGGGGNCSPGKRGLQRWMVVTMVGGAVEGRASDALILPARAR